MSASDATVWIFLAIFVLSAAIALASLPEWISIGDYYKKKLFLLLLLEVIGCIVGFGAGSVRSILTSVPLSDIRSTMISNESGWEFQDAQEERIFRFRFEPGPDNSVTFLGETYHLADYARKQSLVERWTLPEGSKRDGNPGAANSQGVKASTLSIPPGTTSITFDAIKSSKTDRYSEWSDKKVKITLRIDRGLSGTVSLDGSTARQQLSFMAVAPK